jgi:glutamyl-tRNA synthetase
MGIMPETILNFLALLGWNDGTTQEIFSREELIAKFDLSRVQKGGAQFNEDQLIHLNGVYIRALSIDDLNKKVTEFWPVSANQFDDEYKKKVLNLVQDRLKYFEELPKLTELFFEDLPVDINLINNNKFLGIIAKNELTVLLQTSKKALKNSDFSVHNLTQILNDLLNETNQKPVVLFSLIRIATTQAPSSPGLAETISVIGRDRTFSRIDKMLDALNAD